MLKSFTRMGAAAVLVAGALTPAAAAWQPTENIELVVPAKGGGGDQLARKIVEVVENMNPSPLPSGVNIQVVNMSLVSGAQAYLHVKKKPGDAHTLLITLSSLFTLPIARKSDFHWKELTPIARLALDEFVLWVNAESGVKNAKEFAQWAKDGDKRMGGTGSAQEDQIVTVMLAKAIGTKFQYVPFSGGGEVAKKLEGKFIDSSVNNPSEADKLWDEGKVLPLGVFDSKRINFAGDKWKKVPTMKEQGFDVEYLMLRGIFGPPDMPAEAKAYYTKLLEKVSKDPLFKKYVKDNALVDAYQTGPAFAKWLGEQEEVHREMLKGIIVEEK